MEKWKITDILKALEAEHEAAGRSTTLHNFARGVACPGCVRDVRKSVEEAPAEVGAIIDRDRIALVAALAVPWEPVNTLNDRIADALVETAKRLNVPKRA